MTARQKLSRQRVGLASPDNSDTHDSNGGRGRRDRRDIGGISHGGPEPAELQATQWRLWWRTGDVARRRRRRTGSRRRRTWREPAAGVMDRRRSGQRSDLKRASGSGTSSLRLGIGALKCRGRRPRARHRRSTRRHRRPGVTRDTWASGSTRQVGSTQPWPGPV